MLTLLALGFVIVAELPDVAKLSDERGQCPRYHRVAIAPDSTLGCWTMDRSTRELRIDFPGKPPITLTRLQVELYLKETQR